MSDNKPSADAALHDVLERSLDAAETRPLADLLSDVVVELMPALECGRAWILVWAADGQTELTITGGDDSDDVVDNPTVISAPMLVRGRPAGVVRVAGSDGAALSNREPLLQNAAIAIAAIVERSRTAEANRRRERWLSGGTEIARALTTAHHPDPLAMIAERACEIAGADGVVIFGPGALPGLLRVEASAGVALTTPRQQVADTDDGAIQRVLTEGRAIRIDDLRAAPFHSDLLVDAVLLAPMHGSTGLRGVMGLGRVGRGTFSESELGMATMFAGTVALALELAESQNRREQTALILERDRIARDLHDHVIQRLYAIGLTMQHVSSLAGEETAERLVTAVTDIDAAIAQIRSTIFRLSMPILGADVSLRARAEALVDELEPVLGYRASLVSEGPLDFGLDDDLVTDCEAVLREGITNIARHAQATRADVKIAVGRDHVQIEIGDNGRGLGDTDRRSGLSNLRQRAEQHGGTLEIVDVGDVGTRLIWTVPLGE